MDPLERMKKKEWVIRNFSPPFNPITDFSRFSASDYIDALAAISSKVPFSNVDQNDAVCRFLFAGCIRFGRWFAPSPYTVTSDLGPNFEKFVDTLVRAEHNPSENAPVFRLHAVRDFLYNIADEKPLDMVPSAMLETLISKIDRINTPIQQGKKEEFLKEKEELLKIIAGIQAGRLRTVFKTKLPYVLVEANLTVCLEWNGIKVEGQFLPVSQTMEEFRHLGSTVRSDGVTRWQIGTTEITLEFSALIDGDVATRNLTFMSHQSDTIDRPKCLNISFAIIHDIALNLLHQKSIEGAWIPAPRDIGDLTTSLKIDEVSGINWKHKVNSSTVSRIFQPTTSIIDLGKLKPIRWSTKCKLQTDMYLALGDTNEALIWLNVAIESLFRERFEEIASLAGRPELEKELNSPKAFWTEADAIVRAQFPEIADKIDWPEAEVHVSVYAKLKYLYKELPMKTGLKDLLRHYGTISKYRNPLFHGRFEERLPVQKVSDAIESYTWIESNMMYTGT